MSNRLLEQRYLKAGEKEFPLGEEDSYDSLPLSTMQQDVMVISRQAATFDGDNFSNSISQTLADEEKEYLKKWLDFPAA
jgi:hypothetical protein